MKIPLKDVLLYMGVKGEADPDTLRLALKAADKAEKIIVPKQSVRIFDVTKTEEGFCAGGVEGIHVYVMNNVATATRIAENVKSLIARVNEGQ